MGRDANVGTNYNNGCIANWPGYAACGEVIPISLISHPP